MQSSTALRAMPIGTWLGLRGPMAWGAACAFVAASLLVWPQARAQETYPARPVRLVVGFAPGGAADTVARAMSDAMGKALGQNVIVENKPGAGSSVAAEGGVPNVTWVSPATTDCTAGAPPL